MSLFSKFFKWIFGSSEPTLQPVDLQPVCLCYTVKNSGGEFGPSFQVSYVNCLGKPIVGTINPSETLSFCARENSVITYAQIVSVTKCSEACGAVSGTTDL